MHVVAKAPFRNRSDFVPDANGDMLSSEYIKTLGRIHSTSTALDCPFILAWEASLALLEA